MVRVGKANSITVIVRDRKKGKSKSFTVYDANVNEVIRKIKRALR